MIIHRFSTFLYHNFRRVILPYRRFLFATRLSLLLTLLLLPFIIFSWSILFSYIFVWWFLIRRRIERHPIYSFNNRKYTKNLHAAFCLLYQLYDDPILFFILIFPGFNESPPPPQSKEIEGKQKGTFYASVPPNPTPHSVFHYTSPILCYTAHNNCKMFRIQYTLLA